MSDLKQELLKLCELLEFCAECEQSYDPVELRGIIYDLAMGMDACDLFIDLGLEPSENLLPEEREAFDRLFES